MSAEDYKKISFGFRPDNRFFIFRDAAAKKTGFSFRIPFGQAAIHPIQLIHLLLSPVRILFLLIAPVGQPEDSYACRYDLGLSYAARKREIIFVSWNCQKKKNFL